MHCQFKVWAGMILLVFGISLVSAMAEETCGAAGKRSGVSSSSNSRTSFCKEVAKMIREQRIDKFAAEAVPLPVEMDPHGCEYRNLDIDGDGLPDKVSSSSGSGESLLVVQLSSGGEYDFDQHGFITIVRIEERNYALVTYWDTSIKLKNWKLLGHRLYELTKIKAELVCGEEELKRR